MDPKLLTALEKPETYPEDIKDVKRITTAASIVFLTGTFAYKVNKPVNFGFLDFSTLENRKEQCQKELFYNQKISPELYLEVVTINDDNGVVAVNGPGPVIEYALKMKQVDPNATMNVLLEDGKITEQQIITLAEKIFSFHQTAPQSAEISKWGMFDSVKFNVDENFEQTEKYIGELLSQEDFVFMKERAQDFMDKNKELFNQRIAKNKIKHCHGDFHSGNVFITPEIYIFDSIVFNERFPCSDVIAEIAYMTMDLEYHHHNDFSKTFIQKYQELSQDEDIPALLNFYKAYRAYIKAKINAFTSEDKNLSNDEKHGVKEKAQQYFQLAKKYYEVI